MMQSSHTKDIQRHETAARRVEVTLPEGLNPAALSSIVVAVEGAMAVLVEAQGDVILRADKVAEVATLRFGPDAKLQQDRLNRRKTMKIVFDEGQWLTAEDLHDAQPKPPASKSLPASDWKRRGRIFGVTLGGKEYFAAYQFDAMHQQPLPVIKEILDAFGEVADPWTLAAWFHFPNGWLAKQVGDETVALAPKDALDQRAAVVRAAAMRQGSYAA